MKFNHAAAILAFAVFCSTTGFAQGFLTNGLVAYYPLNGGANDESGNMNNGIVVGAVSTADKANAAGRAYGFDGAGARIELPSLYTYSPTNLTFSAWINLRTLGTRKMIVAKLTGGDTPGNVALEIRDSIIVIQFNNGGWHETRGNSQLATNVWYHVAATYDGLDLKVFLNGVEDGNSQYPEGMGVGSIPWMIGVHPSASGGIYSGFDFDGSIDEVRIHSRALSERELKDLYAYETEPRPWLSVEVKTVSVSMHVTPAKRYQLEASRDLSSWILLGEPFVASTAESVQEFNAAGVGRYFRLQELP